jgi:hypothetical protein
MDVMLESFVSTDKGLIDCSKTRPLWILVVKDEEKVLQFFKNISKMLWIAEILSVWMHDGYFSVEKITNRNLVSFFNSYVKN